MGPTPAGDLVALQVDTAEVEPVAWGESPRRGHRGLRSGRKRSGPAPQLRHRVVGGAVLPGAGLAVRLTGSVEHTAPLPRGSSGGPLVDARGRLVGLNTHRPSEGLYLARGADADLRRRVDELLAGRSVQPRRLGVALAPAEAARRMRAAVGLDPRDGLLVRGVVDGSPAERSDLRTGDLIVAVDGTAVATVDELLGRCPRWRRTARWPWAWSGQR